MMQPEMGGLSCRRLNGRTRDILAEIAPRGGQSLESSDQCRNPLWHGPQGPAGDRRIAGIGKTFEWGGVTAALHGATFVHWPEASLRLRGKGPSWDLRPGRTRDGFQASARPGENRHKVSWHPLGWANVLKICWQPAVECCRPRWPAAQLAKATGPPI